MNVVIVQTVDKNDFVIQCGYCRGRGLKPKEVVNYQIKSYTSYTCDICNGKGVLRVQVTDILVPDARCQATGLERADNPGSYSSDYPVKCSTCQGVGARSLSGTLKLVK